MDFKLKMGDLVGSLETIQEYAKRDLPAVLIFKIARLTQILAKEKATFDESRNKLFQKYGKQQDNELLIEPNSENFQKFIKELNPILLTEVTIQFDGFSLKDFENLAMDLNTATAFNLFTKAEE